MTIEDRVLALFAEANPVSDNATLDDLMRPTLSLIEQGEETMSDTKQQPINIDRPIVKQERARGLLYGVAAAVMALVLGTAAWVGLAGSGEKTLAEAAEGGDPVALIEVFYQRWSEGDVDGALEFVRQDSNSTMFLRGMMEYIVALEPDGWSWSVAECAEQVPDVYRCRLDLIGDPVLDAMDLTGGFPQYRIDGNRLTEVNFSSYIEADLRLAVYAEAQDPFGYEAVCIGANGLTMESNGVVYNGECGSFLAPYIAPLAAELTAP